MEPLTQRITSVDVYRGLVMLLLVPDVNGGFSFYRIARELPTSELWAGLARQFSHAPWSGYTIWDMVMPSFVFLVGVGMALSSAARRNRGEPAYAIAVHAWLRAIALFLLALLLRVPQDSNLAALSPFVIIAAGLPVPDYAARLLRIDSPQMRWRLTLAWWLAMLLLGGWYLSTRIYDIGDYGFVHVFSQLGLASGFAYLCVGRRLRTQLLVAAAILIAYWLLFALWPLSTTPLPPEIERSRTEVFTGFFAHWNKNDNVAAVFDVWLLNLLPRSETFAFDWYGNQTLSFIPTIANMIAGVIAGEWLARERNATVVRNQLLRYGLAAFALGTLLGWTLSPIVKSVWTSSWTILSAGVTLLILGVLHHLFDVRDRRALAFAFVVIGTNAMLMYTLALNFRWWFLAVPHKVVGAGVFDGIYGPLWESLTFGAMLWATAFVLYRLRVFVRL